MVRRTPYRIFRALQGLCRPRSLILVTMVTGTLWFVPPPRWKEMRLMVLLTEKRASDVSSPCGGNGSCSSSTTLPTPTVLPNASSTTGPPLTVGYLSQRAPMAGTGQGNLMFMYASMLGIAAHAQMVPDYPSDGLLKTVFAITTSSLNPINSGSYQETKACTFDANLFSLSNRNNNLTIYGYLQSWRYFGDIKDRILQEFTFRDEFASEALNFLRNVSLLTKATSLNRTAANETLYIGVHIRRKDMLADYNIVRGYTVASKEYLTAAVNRYRTDFPTSYLIFVVCGDELDWSKQNFPTVDRNSSLVFSENRSAAHDMAILAACNHTIITVGTFGWWSGYLAGGRTIYYKNFPASGTHIDSLLKKEDYFPPHWIGL